MTEFGDLSGKTSRSTPRSSPPRTSPRRTPTSCSRRARAPRSNYEGSKEFEAQLVVRVKGGNPPDIAYVPQPGLLNTLVSDTGKVSRGSAGRSPTTSTSSSARTGRATARSTASSTPLRWAPTSSRSSGTRPTMFEDNGWRSRTTWDELIALSDKIAATGIKPWCAGIGSGEATGWPATDWLEDVMLRDRRARRLRPVGQARDPVQRPEVAAALDEVGDDPEERQVRQRRPRRREVASPPPPFQDGGLPILDGKCCACTARRASTRPTGPRAPRSPRTATSSRSTCRRSTTTTASRSSAAASSSTAFDDRPEVQAFQTYLSIGRLGQREGQGHPGRRLGQRQQGPGRRQPGQPDRPARPRRSCRTRSGVPLRRLGPDARRGGRRLLLEGDDRLDHRAEHQDDPRQHRESSWPS